MGEVKRATVYLDAHIHRILKIKAAESGDTVSNLINQAVRQALREDAADLAAFDERGGESDRSFADLLQELEADGRL